MIRPIETEYAGCRFRSRLEARWAVFFDQLGIEWEYEPEGFENTGLPAWDPAYRGKPGGRDRYLPDFLLHLPDGPCWFEVKPLDGTREDDRWYGVGKGTERQFVVAFGMPRDWDPWSHPHGDGWLNQVTPHWDNGFQFWECNGRVGISFEGRHRGACACGGEKAYQSELGLRGMHRVNRAYAKARSERFGT